MAILNLTQHLPSDEQVVAGVVDLPTEAKQVLKGLLDFHDLPTSEEITVRAVAICAIAKEYGAKQVMLGGAPFLMGTLEAVLKDNGIKPLYAFSKRISVEKTNPDGTVVKTSEFKHMGFVEV